jgi:PhoH-like ATPase
MKRKNYVLDTSIFVHNPECLKVFKGNNIIIPITVLEELDHLKVRHDGAGINARVAIRRIDEFCSKGDIGSGVDIGNGITIFIDVKNVKSDKFNAGNKDDCILACASCHEDAILVSKDINMRLRSKAHGIEAQDYEDDKLVSAEYLYSGFTEIDLDQIQLCDNFYARFSEKGMATVLGSPFDILHPNEFIQVTANGRNSLFRRHADDSLKPVKVPPKVFGLSSRGAEQAAALDLLLDPNIHLVSLIGRSGSGKSILTLAAALEQVIERKAYNKVEIYRPVVGVGNNALGFIPGTIEEKLAPWMIPIMDNLEVLMPNNFKSMMDHYEEKIKMEAITYVRGRSIPNTFIMCDEFQNTTKSDIKALLTRAGEKTKIVLTGDVEQIDSVYLNTDNNGLTHAIEAFKNSKLAGHITLKKCERSALSDEAAKLL